MMDLHLSWMLDKEQENCCYLEVCQWVEGESLGGGGSLHRNDNCRLKHPSPPHLREATKIIFCDIKGHWVDQSHHLKILTALRSLKCLDFRIYNLKREGGS